MGPRKERDIANQASHETPAIKIEKCDIRKEARNNLSLRLRHESTILYPPTVNP